MCKFCESEKIKINIDVRSTYQEDNVCELVCNNDCSSHDTCEDNFIINSYKNNHETYFNIEYKKFVSGTNSTLIVKPFTESIKMNFCLFCGRQLSKNITPMENMSFIREE